MRTDVKVGLVCVFAVVLAVVCYFTLHDKNRNVVSTPSANSAATPPSNDTSASTGTLSIAPTTTPSAAAPDLSTSPSMPGPSGGSLLGPSVAYGQVTPPANNLGGTVILPPGAASQPAAPTPTIVMPNNNPNSLGGSLAGSMSTPLIPSPGLTSPATPSSPGLSTSPLAPAPTEGSTSSILPPSSPFASPTNGSLTTGATPSKSTKSTHGAAAKPKHPTPTIDLTTPTPTPSVDIMGGSMGGTGAVYAIQKGDTLGSLAKRNSVSVKAILAANPGVNPNRLKVGQKVKIPAPGSSATSRPASSSRNATTRSTTTKKSKVAATRAALAKGGTYTIHKGDTLRKVAKSVYGDENMWRRIFRINRGDLASPNDITVGEVIKLPSTK